VGDADGPALERLIGTVWAEYPGCVLDVDGEEPWLRAPGSAYVQREGEPGRAMWVLPAPPLGPPGPAGPSEPADQADPAGLADPADAVLACVALRELPSSGSSCELKSLYVAGAARRRRFGEALVRRVEREARLWGCDHLVLWTDTRFTDAHRLYTRLGYAPTGRSRDLHDLSATTELEFHRALPAIRGL
jgi:GNAT superfamily N-acetyltransferase